MVKKSDKNDTKKTEKKNKKGDKNAPKVAEKKEKKDAKTLLAEEIKKREAVKTSLLEQLAFKGASLEHYEDLIEDYLSFWDIKIKLIKDIKKRGIVYKDFSSTGVSMMKNNPSNKDLVMVSKQMLSILKELGLKTNEAGGGEDDEL